MYVCMYIFMHIYIYIYIYVYVNIYAKLLYIFTIYIYHIYIYIYIPRSQHKHLNGNLKDIAFAMLAVHEQVVLMSLLRTKRVTIFY